MIVPHDERPPFPRAVRRGAARRVGDRRTALAQMLAMLSARRSPADTRPLRQIFEEEFRRLVPVRDVHVRELPPRFGPSGALLAPSRDSLTFEVPCQDPTRLVVLEARLEAGCRFDDWDVQMLGTARHIASLVLDAERGRALRTIASRRSGAAPLVGSSVGMCALRGRIARLAATDFTILIEGESGTGKELVARQIHEMSPRRNGPFVAINCAALVESLLEAELFGIEDRTATGVRGRRGKFEHADGGTLFLDEVSDLSISAQAKLLRAIQEMSVERVGGQGTRRVDTRIVAASNRSLSGLVERRLFRTDLFYRLSGVDLQVPALRCRREDIVELAEYFLSCHRETRKLKLTTPAIDALLLYDWPGNVRELERLMERAVALAEDDELGLDDLPPSVRGEYATTLQPSLARGDTMRAWGARYAWLVLERCQNNKRRACAALDVSYHTLQSYLRHYAELARDAAAIASVTAAVASGGDGPGSDGAESPPGGGAIEEEEATPRPVLAV